MSLQGKKIFVTGACGFIGSHLVERLVELGADVRALVYYNSFNNWGWLDSLDARVQSQIDVVAGDIRDAHAMHKAIADREIVFHLAALIAIPYSYQAPASYVQTNVQGSLNIFEAARAACVEKVIHTSTSEVYGTAQFVPITEQHPLQGQSPYSATKIGADAMAESFYRSFQLPVATVRPFNTYGPRQSARAVIPTIITQVLSGASSIRLGSQHPTRDFCFVKDTVEGFVKLAQTDAAVGTVTNIGTGSEISIGQLVELVRRCIGVEFTVQYDDTRVRPALSEVERLLAGTQKLQSMTGWQPSTSLEQGLVHTIEWFRGHWQSYKSGQYNV